MRRELGMQMYHYTLIYNAVATYKTTFYNYYRVICSCILHQTHAEFELLKVSENLLKDILTIMSTTEHVHINNKTNYSLESLLNHYYYSSWPLMIAGTSTCRL